MSVVHAGLQIRLVSSSDDLIGIVDTATDQGSFLDIELSVDKVGGLNGFNFQVSKDNSLPLTTGTYAQIWLDGIHWYTGMIKELPTGVQDDPILNIEVSGIYLNLKNKTISETYTAQTFDTIIKDLASTYLDSSIDVVYDVTKIDSPTISNITIEFKDKTLFECFERLLSIANLDYNTIQYSFIVDRDRKFCFYPLSDTILDAFSEGIDYNAPEINLNRSELVNSVRAYRTKSAVDDETEFVNTFDDADSIANNGLREEKIVVPDFLDSTTIESIADSILQEFSEPKIIEEIKNFIVGSTEIEFGPYRLLNRLKLLWMVISNCNSFTDWSFGSIGSIAYSLSSTKVITNKQSFKFVASSDTNGEFAELTLPIPITFPQSIRSFVFFESINDLVLDIVFESSDGSIARINYGTLDSQLGLTDDSLTNSEFGATNDFLNSFAVFATSVTSEALTNWVEQKEDLSLEVEDDFLEITFDVGGSSTAPNPAGFNTDVEAGLNIPPADQFGLFGPGTLVMEVSIDGVTEEGFEIVNSISNLLFDVSKVRVEFISGYGTVYVDRIDTLANQFGTYDLFIEQIKYNLNQVSRKANIVFGQRRSSIVDEILKGEKEGNTIYNVLSKE